MHTVYPATTLDVSISYQSADYPVPTYTTGTAQEALDGWAFFTSQVTLNLPNWSNGSGRPAIMGCHGTGVTGRWSFSDPEGPWGEYVRFLVDSGFVVLGVDQGYKNVGNNLAMRALDLAYTYLTGITGGTKVGIIGSSMGGMTALNWTKKRPTQVGGVFLINPQTDLEASRGSVWWNTPYSVEPGDPNEDLAAGYDSGIDPGGSTGAYKTTGDADFFTNAVDQGHVPGRYPEDFAGHNMVIAHAYRDNTIPYQMSEWFVSAVNSPTVKFRPVTASTAAHLPRTLLAGGADDAATIAAGGLPRAEIRDFFSEVL